MKKRVFENLAVFYRGHLRTWKYVKDVNFAMFESLSKNVDYYFTTWNEPYLDVNDLQNDFKGRNLIKVLTLEKDNTHFNPWFSPSWMMHNIMPYKLEREKTIKYDAVIDIRPDVIIYNKHPEKLQQDTYYTEYENYYHMWTGLGVSDICTIVTSQTFDKMTSRYKFEIDSHPEQHLREFLIKNNIHIQISNILETTIVRPITLDKIKDPFQIRTLKAIGQKFMDKEWQKCNLDDKLNYMKKYNINYLDYVGWNIHNSVSYDFTNNHDKVKKADKPLYRCICGCNAEE